MSDNTEPSSYEAEGEDSQEGAANLSGADSQFEDEFGLFEIQEHAQRDSLARASRFLRNEEGHLDRSHLDALLEDQKAEVEQDEEQNAEEGTFGTIDHLTTRPSFNDAIDETDVFSISAIAGRQQELEVLRPNDPSSEEELFSHTPYQFQRLSGDGHIITRTSVSDKEWRRREERRALSQKRPIIPRWALLLAALVALAGLGVFLFMHRPVEFNANGKRLSATNGSTLESIFQSQGRPATPGNFVSVSGALITEGEGNPFVASVDGTQMDYEEAAAYRIHGGEEIEFSQGSDIMEEYDVELVDLQPTLRVEGTAGSISYISQWAQVGQMEIRTGKTSGEKANGDVIKPVQDCIVEMRNITPKDNAKLVALTFDDGPSEYTESILRILRDRGAVATFFNYGDNINNYPDACRAIAQSGNQLCNHGMQHIQHVGLDGDTIFNEILAGHNTIRDITAVETTFLRPPYGEFNEYTWLATRGELSAAITWTKDTLDWSSPGTEVVVSRALNDIQPGDVILMHDGGGYRGQTVEALPQIIDALRREGYTFVTISDLMRSAGDIPEEICQATARMPETNVWPETVATTEPAEEVPEG